MERNLSSFLEAGRALLAIRDERLYRVYGTWEQYCPRRFGITQSRGLELIRSAETVENLLRGPVRRQWCVSNLRIGRSQSSRAHVGLEPALACACWRLAARIGKPTGHVVGQIVRVVKGAIQEGQNNRATITRHQNEGTHRTKEIFWPSVYRLAATNSFSAQVVILRITDEDHARRYAAACRILFNRCQAVLTELERHFPAL